MRGDAAGEVERRLGDREGVAGIEADSDAPRALAKVRQLLAAEILMVFDRQRSAVVEGARPAVGERGPNLRDQLLPFVPERVAVAAEHRGQAVADDLGVERAGRAQRALERTHHQAGADDGRHAEAREPVAEGAELIVAQRPEPWVDRSRAPSRRARPRWR